MTDEELEQIRAIVHGAVAPLDAKIDRVAAGQEAMRSDMNAKFGQLGDKIDHVDTRVDRLTDRTDSVRRTLNRVAVRADDVMASQSRIKTDIAAIRAVQEDGGRTLADEFREDVEDLRERVEALEEKGK